ncbi:ABC transporter ATP-binding protein [Paenibacillus sp. FSL H8-0548]|uniref:ABC transporter ATP-binding protein n=1 Tax=Paenibacillus sp. FSL H8-0548 TaxID=1920422 RepID=UPI00097016B2|nr:ABC transporter ATP-binding protein [Paenibacillus sp. FSL H8-0548]OMF29385.1 ABC transporter ATP-binding protein [Paenibacillus sp. FSL H8-0548]
MSDITLSVRGLRKVIGKRTIIKDLSFELKRGEVFGFLGPNGAGKTTTIRMLVGLIKPTSGSIEICGLDISKHFTRAMGHMGCIVENPELYPFLTGMENLRHFAVMISGITQERIDEVVALVGMRERMNDKVSTYSLGMRQRLGIAQALLGKPDVLILDEPTNGLDPSGIREMRAFIRFLAEEEGLTVLVSSHLLHEIQLMCDRVAIISKGEIIRVDSVQQLLSSEERLVWRLLPHMLGRTVISELTAVLDETDETVTTAYLEPVVGEWNRRLVEAGVTVLEMNRKLPALEDLFLELTGGESID